VSERQHKPTLNPEPD